VASWVARTLIRGDVRPLSSVITRGEGSAMLRVVEEGWQDPIRLIVPGSGSDTARIPPHPALSRSRQTVAGW
jgi:hypothetical protein